jgi:threonine/homoserine/homoserine lactone efflux protein
MIIELLLANILSLITFAFTTSVTPGPNNLMLTASGANFGFKRTIPHMLGIGSGLFFLNMSVALGFGVIFAKYPDLHSWLRWVGACYLFYLAWKIGSANGPGKSSSSSNVPFSFVQASAFQFVNPKAWIMSISAMTTFTLPGDAYLQSAFYVALIFGIVNLPTISLWASFGMAIGRYLSTAAAYRRFNISMGVLTASSVVLLFI